MIAGKLPNINRRILETIERSKYPKEVKDLLRSLLAIELKNFSDKNPRYGEDYDRVIKEIARKQSDKEDG